MQTFELNPMSQTKNLDDLLGQIKPGDQIHAARGHTSADSIKGITLYNGCRWFDVGDRNASPPMKVSIKNPGSSAITVPQGVKDVEIHGLTADCAKSGDTEGSVVNAGGENIRCYDIHAVGTARCFSVMSAINFLIDGWTSESGAMYPGGYGGTRDGGITNPPTGIQVLNGMIKMVGKALHGIRISRGVGIRIYNVSCDGHLPTARTAFNLKTPGPIDIDSCTSWGCTGLVTGPLGEGDGMGQSDWKTLKTILTTVTNCKFLEARFWSIDLEAGILKVVMQGGKSEYSGMQCAINVRGEYSGWDFKNKKPIKTIPPIRLPATGTLSRQVKITSKQTFGGVPNPPILLVA